MFRLLDTPPASGAFNMAMDESLMASVRQGGRPVLRFYRWEPGCLSLGRNQPARDIYDRERITELGLEVVRRPTGGRAVLHHRELTYSVVAADGWLGDLRTSYQRVNRALAAGLRHLGIPAEVVTIASPPAPVSSAQPCFRAPVVGEVVAGGRKLIGSAQVREQGVMLQHGSLLLHDDQGLLAQLSMDAGPRLNGDAPATLAEFLPRVPDWSTLTAALAAGWQEEIGEDLEPEVPADEEFARMPRLLRKHRDLEWIWRR